ncbi:maleate cis-trans isomerase [Rhizobium giardinii]|uniref:Maleate cis-trans isomerase n=2 Tax=Rhizobium giardinii TaxID=56731 RepID=A0A7W8XBH8_9HYPH|nr:maleate cis-trans isomerase [Rhizobium giardinii]
MQAMIQAARPGVSCTTPLTAAIAALDQFEARRIAVLTPYTDQVNQFIASSLEAGGTKVTSFASFKILENELMAKLTPKAIMEAALAMDLHGADALFISCTALRAVDVVEEIERKLGKPVVTAVQALYWHSLRLAGYSRPISGFGKLLAR